MCCSQRRRQQQQATLFLQQEPYLSSMAQQKSVTHPNAVEDRTTSEKGDELPPPYTATPQILNRNSFSSSSSSYSSSGDEGAVSPDALPSFTSKDVHPVQQSPGGHETDLQPMDRKASWKEWKALKKAQKVAMKEEKRMWKAERKMEKEVLKRARKSGGECR
ncbi:unnamed protein product [Zymoseptoria tritici ST99CH_1E4]|uniref:Uncharacterized protein n=2 Tax=Zymoseptoria tritici TaxID=1047171 RepID=F9XKA6_ZYMTI|nr:uncharacterized protein MYCGRDRAFT_105731 [Zymoseptoria tritici IPO323]EGP84377.1 hypothetical protein MYCGRDRAFT_105731 [Zymoseptoria tritici IPO323]SMR58522.1 unnamed protein product [Zymoseptoria tritici ST99CH_1E4]